MTGPRPSMEDVLAQTQRPPMDEVVAASGDPMAKWHAAYKSGDLQAHNSIAGAQDTADAAAPNRAQQVAEAVTSGLPGASRAVAGYRGLLSLVGIGNETPDEALTQQRSDVSKLPAKARIPLQLLGGVPAAVAAAPLGLLGGGAAIGAAAGADAPADGGFGRLKNIATGTATGAVTSKLAGMIGGGLANLSARTGLTNKVAQVVGRVNPEAGAAMGTRGQVNSALSDRQDILAQLGGPDASAGQVQLDRIAATKAKAGELYGIARQDQQAINDPRVQALLQDPEVARTFATVKAIRAAKGTPVPEVNSLGSPPQAQMNKLIRPEDWQKMMQNPANAAALQQLPTGLSGLTTESLPDPEALATMKRYLNDASRGLNSPLDIKKDAAIATMDKMAQLRTVLHEVSPAYQTADAFYADAKGQEDAFAHGFDAFKHANNPSGEQLPSHTPEAMLQNITTPRYPGEPPDAMANRADAFRAGAKSATATQITGAPVDANLRSITKVPALAGDQETQKVRALMFKDPSAANAFEQATAGQRGAVMATPAPPGLNESDLAYHSGRVRAAMRAFTNPPDALATPQGQQLLSARQANPSLMTSEIMKQKAGESALAYAARIAALDVGHTFAPRP